MLLNPDNSCATDMPDLQRMKLLLLCGVVGTEVGIPLVRLSPI